MNERDIIHLLRDVTGAKTNSLVRGIGDDCAVIKKSPGVYWLVSTDTLVESVHFDTRWHPAGKIGRKSVSVNVSDIAAMGGTPHFIFLSLALPAGFDHNFMREFSSGIKDACREYGCILAGGDTVHCSDNIVITVTVIGEVESENVLYRDTAMPGDDVWVSGFLGQAAAGLELCRAGTSLTGQPSLKPLIEAHLNPQPRVELGRTLAREALVHAMMDLSDGLSTDLAHICASSGVGALLDPGRLPISQPLLQASQILGMDPVMLAVSGGEDYELVFTAAKDCRVKIDALLKDSPFSASRIGEISSGEGVKITKNVTGEGGQRCIDISFTGYDHFR